MQFFYFSFLEIYKTKGVRQLLLESNKRLLTKFIPKLIIFRAMLHLNKIVNAKKKMMENKQEEKTDLFSNIKDKKIDFGKLSAKENIFEIVKGKFPNKLAPKPEPQDSQKNQTKNLKSTESTILTNSDRLNRTISESQRTGEPTLESLRLQILEVKGKHIEILRDEDVIVYKESFRKATQNNIDVLYCDHDLEDTKMFGYLFILQNLLSVDFFNRFVQLARQISFENEQVIRDIQDFFIVESLRSVGEEYFQDKQKASAKMKFFNDQKQKENLNASRTLRPPFVWNSYQSKIKQKVRFFSVDPFKQFPDLAFLNEELEIMGQNLLTHNSDDWNNFQNQLISFFNHQKIKDLD